MEREEGVRFACGSIQAAAGRPMQSSHLFLNQSAKPEVSRILVAGRIAEQIHREFHFRQRHRRGRKVVGRGIQSEPRSRQQCAKIGVLDDRQDAGQAWYRQDDPASEPAFSKGVLKHRGTDGRGLDLQK